MIQATARVLHNVIEVRTSDEQWVCRPVATAQGAITRRLQALFSTTYEVFRSTAPQEVYSTVSYHVKKDEILVQIGEQKWHTVSSLFGPMSFDYAGKSYTIHEKLTGKFFIVQEGAAIAEGELGFRSCQMRKASTELEPFLANLAVGYLIRTLVWEMFR